MKQLKMKQKSKKSGLTSMLLGTLGASLQVQFIVYTGKRFKRSKIPGQVVIRAGERTVRADQNF